MHIFSDEDFLLITRDLEMHHSIFSKLWTVGKPEFSDEIPTAAMTFDKSGNFMKFLFNKDFWDTLSYEERKFVVCHEILHLVFNHGERLSNMVPDIGNIAADVVINEMLVNSFGFNRNALPNMKDDFCFYNTVFKDKNVEEDKCTEYYYNLLVKEFEAVGGSLSGESGEDGEGEGNPIPGMPKILDDHEGFKGMSDEFQESLQNMLDEISEEIQKDFNDQVGDTEEAEMSEKSSSKQAGSFAGSMKIRIKLGQVKKKRKWETVIKKWMTKALRDEPKVQEQWTRMNRRFVGFSDTMKDMFIPSEMEVDEIEEDKCKIDVIFFQDTSGSCRSLAPRFFRAAKTLPDDRFNVRMFCFDTSVYETDLKSGKLYGFGGTSFHILEEYVWDKIAKQDESKYPKAVFVITDGYGSKINPKKPKNWHWFLSANYKYCIPADCNTYDLKDFE